MGVMTSSECSVTCRCATQFNTFVITHKDMREYVLETRMKHSVVAGCRLSMWQLRKAHTAKTDPWDV